MTHTGIYVISINKIYRLKLATEFSTQYFKNLLYLHLAHATSQY